MIEIFDSLTHPTIEDEWLNPRFNHCCGLDNLLPQMEKFGIKKTFAVGIQGVGGYELKKYYEFVSQYEKFIPIAFCEPEFTKLKLEEIKQIGYAGIKIHPRLSKMEPDDDRIFEIIKMANDLGLFVLYCGFAAVTDMFIQKIGDAKLIFLHTGFRDIQNTFEKLKNKQNILLDLSYTFTKCPEMDDFLLFLFKNYSDRICIGSDFPEESLEVFRNKFELFSADLDKTHAEAIAYKNIEKFMLQSRN